MICSKCIMSIIRLVFFYRLLLSILASTFWGEVSYWNFTACVCVCLVHFSLFLSDSCSLE